MSMHDVGDKPLSRPRSRSDKGAVRLLIDSGGIGGIERHVAVLAGGLRKANVDARILMLAGHPDNPWIDQLRAADLPFDVVEHGVGGLLWRLRTEPTALLHTHGYKAGILGRVAARAAGVPVISTFHAGETAPFPVSLYQGVDEWTSCIAPRISVSQPIAGRLPFSSRLVPNFIETPPVAPFGELPNSIGFVGRLSHEKGPDLFCEAATSRGVSSTWHVFGDGPMRRALEETHGRDVAFHGMVTDIDRVWPTLGLLVISSRAEGLPMAALEALAAGIPVIAPRIGALPDVIEHGSNGWLFDAGDRDELARLIAIWSARRVGDGPSWRRAAWSRASEKFGVAAGVQKILWAYRAAGFTG
jgi:glycosyltransferase involved in cell wall biosynthesis